MGCEWVVKYPVYQCRGLGNVLSSTIRCIMSQYASWQYDDKAPW